MCESFVGWLVAAFRTAIVGDIPAGEGKLAFLALNNLSSEFLPVFSGPNIDPLPQLWFHLRFKEPVFVLRWSCVAR